MQKVLFFDYRELEVVRGFTRRLQHPAKCRANPLLVADRPWEHGNLQLYGSVVKVPHGPFQLWYSTVQAPWCIRLGYAESEDGLTWERPRLDLYREGGRRTNLVLTQDVHGAAVILDQADPDPAGRYKLVAGAAPSGCVKLFRSPDGRAWRELTRDPQIPFRPDSPMAFLRTADGRYATHHRVARWSRRICRSESFDLRHWSEPRMVLEPGPVDPPQVQFYGMGAAPYGPYEIGTLWIFHTDEEEMGGGHMKGYQDAELTYSRNGFAWHRLEPGTPFLPHGRGGAWDRGNLQCASQPVFLADEIRYYYMGTDMRHQRHWELEPQTSGLGMARLKPDRFLALEAGRGPAELMTVAFTPEGGQVFVNAAIAKGGWVKAELLDDQGGPLRGYRETDGAPVTGDSVAHRLRWRKAETAPTGQRVRVRLRARQAKVYSLYLAPPGEEMVYHRFKGIA
ncbi:MAG: hypothetical protein WDA75_08830 [Candidatus Latescibacterota bacterium]|jgi:hypothetical protein